MQFSFNDEQRLIQESAQQFLQTNVAAADLFAAIESSQGYNAQTWQQISQELMWQAVHIPEQLGGLDLGFVELCILLEQTGEYLLPSPLFASAAMASSALLIVKQSALAQQYLPELASASINGCLALDPALKHAMPVQYQHAAQQLVLNGDYSMVLDAPRADVLFVVAQPAASQAANNANQYGLFAIPKDANGLTIETTATLDQTKSFGKIKLRDVAVVAEQYTPIEATHLAQIIALVQIATSAEQMGGALKTLQLAVDYANERVQFGSKIGSFQALKHKAADMMLKAESAKSGVYYAACIADAFLAQEASHQQLLEAANIAKAYSSQAYIENAQDCIQIHGGVGITWEYLPHLYFKRAKLSEHLFGSPSQCYEYLADQCFEGV